MAKRAFNAYIDEAGDEGWKRLGERAKGADASSEWLILVGVLILEEQDTERTRAIDRLRREISRKPGRGEPPKSLHWRDLRNDHSKKRRAIRLLAEEPLWFSAVALYKPLLEGKAPGLRKKGYLYNYAVRFLVERLSWFAAPYRRVNLLFEDRASTEYGPLIRYIDSIQADPNCSIEPDTIGDVRPVNASTKGAQLADYYVGAAAEALEPDRHGMLEPQYLLGLRRQLFRRPSRSVLADGFKIYPDEAADRSRYPWLDDL